MAIDDINNKPIDFALVAAYLLLLYLKGKKSFIMDVYYKNEFLEAKSAGSKKEENK